MGDMRVNLSGFPDGIYILIIQNGSQIYSHKLFKITR
jgi:hypothetical protein